MMDILKFSAWLLLFFVVAVLIERLAFPYMILEIKFIAGMFFYDFCRDKSWRPRFIR